MKSWLSALMTARANFSEAVTLKNPYYGQATSKPTTVPTATPRPAAKPTQKPGNSGGSSGNGTSGGSQATSQPTALPTFVPTVMPTLVPTLMPTFVPTAEPTAQPTAMPEYIQTGPGQAFTGSGNMRTLDVLYSAHTNKQFISLETKSGQTYYLVIDYDKPIDEEADIYETYFLNLVDDRDLLALLSEDEKPTPTPTAAPTPTPTKEPVQTDENRTETGRHSGRRYADAGDFGRWRVLVLKPAQEKRKQAPVVLRRIRG